MQKMNKVILFSLLILSGFYSTAQRGSGFSYGMNIGLLLNSATLPEIELNTDINSILTGENIVKGKANYADLTYNFRIGGFAKYDHRFGFGMAELNYSTSKIQKDIELNSSKFLGSDNINLTTMEREFSYIDIALSYNIYLSKKIFFSLGIIPAFLLTNSGSEKPNNFDVRTLAGFGFFLADKISISARGEFGITEVYKDSYIHHIMIPVTLRFAF